MNFKLDENLGVRFKKLLIEQGFNTDTVYNEGLQGSPDLEIYKTFIK